MHGNPETHGHAQGVQTAIDALLRDLPWLREPALEVCVVGSSALAVACARQDLPRPPAAHDLDLAWRLTLEEGRTYLAAKGLEIGQTSGAEDRGTLAFRFARNRIELTSFRGGGQTASERMANDAERRDMTIGAVLWRVHDDSIHDPQGGLEDWRTGRIRACGDAHQRIAEHPIRALRYLRRATELGFVIEEHTRRAIRETGEESTAAMLPEAITEELRRVLTSSSPGIFFALASEEQLLEHLIPELARLFDGRRAGRLRWHPEISQGLHTILTLRAAARLAERDKLDESARRRLMLGVLFHDLGKGVTPEGALPSHPGHEAAGVPLVDEIFDRLPGLGDKRARRFSRVVARQHLALAKLPALRAGTLVEMWDRDLVPLRQDFTLLAAAVRADREGRLMPQDLGMKTHTTEEFDAGQLERRVLADLQRLDEILREVRGDEIAKKFAGDSEKIRAALHESRCSALHAAQFRDGDKRK